MKETATPLEMLNLCHWLHLKELILTADAQLRLLVVEARSQSLTTAQSAELDTDPLLKKLTSLARAIVVDTECRQFELIWPFYLAYQIRNESYYLPDKSAKANGQVYQEHASSAYLSYFKTASFADDDFPGPQRHFSIFCQDHVIDVLSTDAPVVRLLDAQTASLST